MTKVAPHKFACEVLSGQGLRDPVGLVQNRFRGENRKNIGFGLPRKLGNK